MAPPGAVDPAFVTPGLAPLQRESNARYALSVIRDMGVGSFLRHEDIMLVRGRRGGGWVGRAGLGFVDGTRPRQRAEAPRPLAVRALFPPTHAEAPPSAGPLQPQVQPRLMLLLFSSLMAFDQRRQQQRQRQQQAEA